MNKCRSLTFSANSVNRLLEPRTSRSFPVLQALLFEQPRCACLFFKKKNIFFFRQFLEHKFFDPILILTMAFYFRIFKFCFHSFQKMHLCWLLSHWDVNCCLFPLLWCLSKRSALIVWKFACRFRFIVTSKTTPPTIWAVWRSMHSVMTASEISPFLGLSPTRIWWCQSDILLDELCLCFVLLQLSHSLRKPTEVPTNLLWIKVLFSSVSNKCVFSEFWA